MERSSPHIEQYYGLCYYSGQRLVENKNRGNVGSAWRITIATRLDKRGHACDLLLAKRLFRDKEELTRQLRSVVPLGVTHVTLLEAYCEVVATRGNIESQGRWLCGAMRWFYHTYRRSTDDCVGAHINWRLHTGGH
jgi:hypothetical protein